MPWLVWNDWCSHKTEHCCLLWRCKSQTIVHLPESSSFILHVTHSSTYRQTFFSRQLASSAMSSFCCHWLVQLDLTLVKHLYRCFAAKPQTSISAVFHLQNWMGLLMCCSAVCGISGNRVNCSAERGCACFDPRQLPYLPAVAHGFPAQRHPMSQGLISCGVRSHCVPLQNKLKHCWCRHDPRDDWFPVWCSPSD